MGLISPAWENLLDFLEFQQVLSSYDRDLCNPLWSTQEMPVYLRVAKGPLGMGSSGCGWYPGDSYVVATGLSWIFLSCSKGVMDPLEVPEVRCD